MTLLQLPQGRVRSRMHQVHGVCVCLPEKYMVPWKPRVIESGRGEGSALPDCSLLHKRTEVHTRCTIGYLIAEPAEASKFGLQCLVTSASSVAMLRHAAPCLRRNGQAGVAVLQKRAYAVQDGENLYASLRSTLAL